MTALPSVPGAAGALAGADPIDGVGARIAVVGIGNPLMGDDGVGLVLLERLMDHLAATCPDADVAFVDGGTIGLSLLPVVLGAESLLVLDAVAAPDAPAGTVVRLDGDQLPRLLGGKVSPHQVGLLDVLTAARLLGTEPVRTTVVGVVPEDVDLRWGLSETVSAGVPAALAAAAAVVATWSADPVGGRQS